MAMVVNHNIPALQSYNALSATNSALQKSIQKLSTGLRINSAADDAAGLAISEKMRAQIRGLDRAVANSQDGISMIQTAEGALSETHSILQRMRELSVQAANDTLTQQDRAYIQLEIDELREEITRIGNTTQFNKKKLLDGSAAVLWSAGDSETKALINGGLRTVDQFGQKSAAEGNYKITVTAKSGSGQVQKTDIFKIKHEATETFTNTLAGATSVVGANLVAGSYGVALASVSAAVDGPTLTAAYNPAAPAATTAAGGAATLSGSPSLTTGANLGGATILLETLSTSGATKVTANIVSVDGTSRTVEKIYETVPSDLADLDAELAGFSVTAAGTAVVGSKNAYKVGNSNVAGVAGQVSITVPNQTAGTDFYVSDNVAGKTVDFIVYSKDAVTGDLTNSKVSITFASDYDGTQATGTATLTSTGESLKWGLIGDEANEHTKLYDIDKFWDSQGKFLLTDPQTITVTQGDGKQTKVTLYANDTIGQVVDKLNTAIGQGLGQGQYTNDQKFAQLGNGAPKSALSTDGTIVISSVVTGSAGKLSFAGDEDLLNALSLNTIKAAKESDYDITIADAHTGNILVDGVQVTGNKLIGLVHENVDVQFDSMLGITATMGADGYYTYTYSATGSDLYLHLADNTTVFQIGANEGEDMGINIGDMRSTALGLDSVLVTDRESAARSITIIDNAIDKVSMQRAKLGAYQNRLEHTINNLTVASENLTAAESRIRDADMAKEMMNYTKLSILLQAGTSMLAQANALPQNVLSLLG